MRARGAGPLTMRRLAFALCLVLAAPALAQVDTREGIFLQNQLLQLRQEIEALRAQRGGGSALAPAPTGRAPSGDVLSQLLERVGSLEEEVRRMRGRVDELDNRNRRLAEDVRKLNEDTEFRFQRIEGGGAAPARPAAPPAANNNTPRPTAPAAPTPPAAPAAAGPRPPERAIAEGRAALQRREYAAAEAAAREVIASRNAAQQVNAQMLLADALSGRRDFGNAAIAYNEAFTRARTGPRAPDALIGLANSFTALNNRREACDTLGDLRSNFQNLSQGLQQQAAAARQRAGCR